MLGEIMNRNYGFTYEITANCNYHCEYCDTFRIGEKISDINVIDNVLYFLNQVYNNLDDTDTLTIQIMGGEPTVHPLFEYFMTELCKLRNIKLILFTNFSADLELYDRLCNIFPINTDFSISYHQNHITLEEYLYKLDCLINKYTNVIFHPQIMLGENRKTVEEIMNIFSKYQSFKNFEMSIFPILSTNFKPLKEPEKVTKDKIINNIEVNYDRNTQNQYYNKFVNCYATNAFINPFGILSNCYANRDKLTIDLNKNKEDCLNRYLKFSTLKIKCNNKFCYYGAQWKIF